MSTTPNMNLVLPDVGITIGPTWAQDLNASLTIVDTHNHTPGLGVQIPTAGLNINADLPMNSQNLITARSLRMVAQGSPLSLPADIGCLYVSGVDLWYNDESGNQVRMTQSGAVAGSPGSISNLVAPASAAYVSANQTFVWQSAASTPANLDAASIILRNLVANSKGLTLNPPAAMGADYSLVLPSLPGSTSFMTVDTSGNMSGSISTTAGITGSNIASTTIVQGNLANNSVGTAQIIDANVTRPKLVAVGQQVSASCGSFTPTGSVTVVTNLSVSITTTGRPVYITLIDADGVFNPNLGISSGNLLLNYRRNSSNISSGLVSAGGGQSIQIPPSSYTYIDVVGAGTYTYDLTAATSGTASVEHCKLFVYEL